MGRGLFEGSGHERPDAQRGAMQCAVPVEEFFCNQWGFCGLRSIVVVSRLRFEVNGAEAIRGPEFKFLSFALLCVPFRISTDPLTGVSVAREERC
jgi:hypothetical protein